MLDGDSIAIFHRLSGESEGHCATPKRNKETFICKDRSTQTVATASCDAMCSVVRRNELSFSCATTHSRVPDSWLSSMIAIAG